MLLIGSDAKSINLVACDCLGVATPTVSAASCKLDGIALEKVGMSSGAVLSGSWLNSIAASKAMSEAFIL